MIERGKEMNKEQLIAAGLTEEQANAVLKLHKDSIDGTYVPKATFEAEREKVKNLNTEVTNRDTQIKELGKFKGTAEELQTKVTQLETSNAEAKAGFEKQLKELTQKTLITSQISELVVDVEDVLPKLDFTKIVFKDDKIDSGLTEQLQSLKQTKPHYFKTEKQDPTPKGWVFGKTPVEGNEDNKGKDNEFVAFGKQLAQNKVASSDVTKKVAENYFK